MKKVIILSIAMIIISSAFVGLAQANHSLSSPDRKITVLIETLNNGYVITIANKIGSPLFVKKMEGLGIDKSQWTGDSNYFVFNNFYSGGHMPWHRPTYFYDVRKNAIFSFDELRGAVTDDFRLESPDVIVVEVQEKINRNRSIPIKENLEDITALCDKFNFLNDVHKRIQYLQDSIKSKIEINNTGNIGDPDRYFSLLFQLIEAYRQEKENITLKELSQNLNMLRYKDTYLIDDIDFNGDGKNEIIYGALVASNEGNNFVLYENNGRTNYCGFGYYWIARMVRKYKSDKNTYVFFLSEGGNGVGYSRGILLGMEEGELKELFVSPESVMGGTSFKDIDGDGEDELICAEQIQYHRLYLPRIYRWVNNKFEEVTFKYPNIIVDDYKSIPFKDARELADKVYQSRSKESKEFWEKYLKGTWKDKNSF